ncbi:hypothetical protein [Coleofasciculus sp. H7-2]|uniref:hypothetical protein n=1 Tax=Coleofasciculus sp. H7-2 TaxID=3351545 RepID=UPI00367257E2
MQHGGITGDILQKNRFLRPTSKEIAVHGAVDEYILDLQGAPTDAPLSANDRYFEDKTSQDSPHITT